MARGKLTEEVKKVSKDTLGYEISMRELRLMPYVMVRTMDNLPIERKSINREENQILNKWQENKFITMSSDISGRKIFLSKGFYKALSAILMVGYCSDMITD